MKSQVLKRTFKAKLNPEDRASLNQDALHSEYFPSHKWLVRTPARMSDGSPNPVQGFHDRTFETKRSAEIYADEHDSALASKY